MNLFIDAIVQPIVVAVIEITLWSAVFASTHRTTINGYPRESYLSYALWAVFFARIAANWMYEMRMIDEVDTGTINSILVRPISYFEYYLSQFVGYKLLTTFISFVPPILICLWFNFPTQFSRLPLALCLGVYHLLFVYSLSFVISSFSFFFNKVHSFTVAKNIALWMFTGEMFPIDLIPQPYREWVLSLPFVSGVYVPVGYLTGRIPIEGVWRGFLNSTIGILVCGVLARVMWLRGRQTYSGTGA